MEENENEFWGELDEVAEEPEATQVKCPTALEQLKDRIRRQRFLPHSLSNEFVRRFLDSTCGDIDEAASKIEKYFRLRQEPGEIFRDVNPVSSVNQKLFSDLYAIPLRNLFYDGEIILLTGLRRATNRYCSLAHFKLLAITIDYLIWDEGNSFSRLKILLNAENFLCPALLHNGYRHFRTFIDEYQNSLPICLAGFYIYKPPEYLSEVVSLLDGLSIVAVYDAATLRHHVPLSILPFEMGGSLGSLDDLSDMWNAQMKASSRFFERFEARMRHEHRRRVFHEREVRDGGKAWVYNMKLCADETEYKIRYYRMMADKKLPEHPAFGAQRRKNKPEVKLIVDPLKKLREEVEGSGKVKLKPIRVPPVARPISRPPTPVIYLLPRCW